MIFSCLQENLKQGLNIVCPIANKNSSLPILNNICFNAKEGVIRLIATNLEIGIETRVRGKIDTEGECLVNAKLIFDFISLLPNKKINFKLKENNLFIETENYNTKIINQKKEDFPLIPNIKKEVFCSIDIEDFKKALDKIIFATALSETRIELTGVFFHFLKNELIIAATDSYRLAEKKIKIINKNDLNEKIIVPVKTLQEVLRILNISKKEDEKEIYCYISENQIKFSFGQTEIISRLIEGQYPDYKQILPTYNKTKAILNKEEFIRAVKVASLFSKTGINDINLDFPANKNQIIISSTSGQNGENLTTIESNVLGQDNGIVINGKYVLDGLNCLNDDKVILEIIDGNTPCVFKGEKEENYIYIIMPIKQ